MIPGSAESRAALVLESLGSAEPSWLRANAGAIVAALVAGFVLLWLRGFMRQRRLNIYATEFAPLLGRALNTGAQAEALSICKKYGRQTHIAAVVLAGLREHASGGTQSPDSQVASRMQTAMELATNRFHRDDMRYIAILYALPFISVLVALNAGSGLPAGSGMLPAAATALLAAWLHVRARRLRTGMQGTAAEVLAFFFEGSTMTNTKAFLEAAESGNIEKVKELLAAGGVDVNALNQWGNTALIEAANHGSTEIVTLLIPHSPRLDLVSAGGRTALMCAAFKGHREIVEALLKAGSSISVKDRDGADALSLARLRSHADIAELLSAARKWWQFWK